MGGIIIGVLLSFGEVAMRAVIPPTAYVGRIPGHGNFYSLKRNSDARPIKNTLIYRFSGNLFFANVDLFCDQIEAGIQKDTQQVVVDARGIGSVDVTATERLLQLYLELKERGIYFYLTEHDGSLNDQLQKMGGERLIQEGVVRRTITLALRDAGLEKPYELEERTETDARGIEAKERLAEFEWVFGADAEKKMEELAHSMAEQLAAAGSKEAEVEAMLLDKEGVRTSWGLLGRFDEHEFWDFMEVNLEELVREGKMESELATRVERHIEKRREFGQKKLEELNPQAAKLLASHGKVIRNYVKRTHPKEYERYLELRGKQRKINDK